MSITTANQLVAEARTNIHEIDCTEAQKKIADGVTLIDVRESAEFELGHIGDAHNIPRGVLEFQVDAHPAVNGEQDPALVDKNKELLVYCLSGGRAALACESLQRMGYTNVKSITGGFKAWRDQGLPVQD